MGYTDRLLLPVLRSFSGRQCTLKEISASAAVPYATVKRRVRILEANGTIEVHRHGRRWGMIITVQDER